MPHKDPEKRRESNRRAQAKFRERRREESPIRDVTGTPVSLRSSADALAALERALGRVEACQSVDAVKYASSVGYLVNAAIQVQKTLVIEEQMAELKAQFDALQGEGRLRSIDGGKATVNGNLR